MNLTLPIVLIQESPMLDIIAKIGLLLVAGLITFALTKMFLVRAANAFARRTKSHFDDILMKEGVFSRAALLAPAPVLFWGLVLFPNIKSVMEDAIYAYTTVAIILVMAKLLDALTRLYQTFDIANRRPIKGYVQLLKLFIYILGAISVVSILLGQSPWGLLSGIGAMTAVLMLVFRDTILSLVAGIQIAANDLLHKGDWIEMPAMGADGSVVDIALNTVKVQNWDMTITAIPTYKFLDTSFKNWQNMAESGGRRIKRALMIDQTSIRFADPEMVERLKKIDRLAAYIEQRQAEIDSANAEAGVDQSSQLNGRRLTNLGLFRRYALEYLRTHPKIRQDMTLLVRQLQPDASKGLPLEIYCFTNETAWAVHEDITSDIMDHLLAGLPEFGLKAYQRNALVDHRNGA
ncbi:MULTISPECIES: mechanosensitive ion channel domain-containing protein [unclassified Pseudodesulfovibrio]|uniref:mechanosensitive ion channel family protein n=1 Tax=unclassified Pseudodesulfovibrio TaxID=2661612 RepID=UPI000FEBEC22|nr:MULTISPECIES: mechanosensitive ion channel domain-containing protein [unclassified Pseudodesulfovibrio]MCJ2165820.1 mechanosensitive ion channel family protein [Pseudodesulfovibrio sp. S3-i]RWU02750.1 mechanosensitive ion channel family protein [Pseudodesulfovibrio sp. S3]